jgi:hypothetical protein
LHLDGWIKDAAPGTELRKWFSHDPAKWEEFRRRYFAELDRAPETWEPILLAARHGTVTLLYSSHDTEHNNAVALREYIEHKKGSGTVRAGETSGGVETRQSHKKRNTGRSRGARSVSRKSL